MNFETQALIMAVMERYHEPWRHYHNLLHVEEMLAFVQANQESVRDTVVVAWAIHYHDAVYVPGAPTGMNEELSAQLAESDLTYLVPEYLMAEQHQLVGDYVRATTEHVNTLRDQPDLDWVLDADLLRLAAPWDEFVKNNEDIRREYQHVPDAEFFAGSNQLLQSFLTRPRIFVTEFAHANYEQQARNNITQLIQERS